MEHHDLIQGTPAWLAHRTSHFNASDAPAMMGCSKYKTRSALLQEIATGLSADVSKETQSLFDAGHRFEALARPLAEEIIGEELYPVVGTSGKLSASFDGLTMAEHIAFEHKSLNAELRAVMVEGCTGLDLPMMYQVQNEQQCMVSGAGRVLFMASKWSDAGELIEERHCWYTANPELAAKIAAGWDQFEADLTEWKPAPAAEIVTATPQNSLPAVSVRVSGELVVASNLPDFGAALRAFIERIPAKPSTDQEFADAEAACKSLKRAEEALEGAETNALAQMSDVEGLRRMVADLRNLARVTRLSSEKAVAARKEQIRVEIVTEGKAALAAHIATLNARLGKPYMPAVAADFAGVIKSKRTVESLRDAVDTELARAKIEASATADRIQINLTTLRELAAAHAFLFADTPQIVLKAADDLTMLVKARIAEHQAAEAKRLEQERESIRAEESARLQREQAEAAAKAQREAEAAEQAKAAEAQRLAKEIEAAQAVAAAASTSAANLGNGETPAPSEREAPPDTPAQAPQQVLKAEAPAPEATDRDVPASTSPSVGSTGAGQPADAGPADGVEPARGTHSFTKAEVDVMMRSLPARTAAERPTLKLGEIQNRLGFDVSSDFLASLGFLHTQEKASKLYLESKFKDICAGISAHVLAVAHEHSGKAALAA